MTKSCPDCGQVLVAAGGAAPLCAHCLLRAGTGRDYSLVSVIGQGEHGTVYLAEQQPSNRLVALKVLKGPDRDATLARLRHGQRALAAFAHPSVCAILDVGGDRDQAYVATEYVRALPITLFCESAAAARDSRQAILTMLDELVCAAHEHGIVHGSIKPSNVLVGGTARQPWLRLTDFAIRAGDARGDRAGIKALEEDLLRVGHAKQA